MRIGAINGSMFYPMILSFSVNLGGRKMAKQLDTTAYTVHRWTTMQATPCAETLAQLCRITGESPAWVLGLTDQR